MAQQYGYPRDGADSAVSILPLFKDYLKKSSHFEFNGCKTLRRICLWCLFVNSTKNRRVLLAVYSYLIVTFIREKVTGD